MSVNSRQYLDYCEDYFYEHQPNAYLEIYEPARVPLHKRFIKAILSIKIRRAKSTCISYAQLQEQQRMEKAATFIQRQIKTCDSPAYLESIAKMISNLPIIHGKSTQVTSWVESLNMQLFLKRKDLSTK